MTINAMEAAELAIVARTLKDVHVAERKTVDATAEALWRMQSHFEEIATEAAAEGLAA